MSHKRTYFTPGPVHMPKFTEEIGTGQLPYFRTSEFSKLMHENEEHILSLVNAPNNSKVLFFSASGTGAMDAAISNLLHHKSKSLVINAGGFGERFCDILSHYRFDYKELKLKSGESASKKEISASSLSHANNIIYNLHETTTGALHDITALSAAAKNLNGLHIVDAISAFLCDDLDMQQHCIDVLILSSQKALGLPPGLSMLVLSPKAIDIASGIESKSYYFSLKEYITNSKRGQTPFTPSVGILLQLNYRLKELVKKEHQYWVQKCHNIASQFRKSIANSNFQIFPNSPSNAITALDCSNTNKSAEHIATDLLAHDIVVTPNGGKLKDKIFRVGHMGSLAQDDYSRLSKILNHY